MEFIESKRGGQILLDSGYQLYLKRKNKDGSCSWTCKLKKNCRGTLTLQNGNVLRRSEHQCVPNDARNDVAKSLDKAKKRAREELIPIPQIFQQEMASVTSAGYEFVTEVPAFRSVKQRFYNARNDSQGLVQFKSREDIVIPEKISNEFLLFDDGVSDRIMGFASTSARQVINEATDFFGDGTFRSCPSQFKQLYCIHADIGSSKYETNIIPVIYALLPDKSEKSYLRLFALIQKYLPAWKPAKFKIDFEIATIQALRKYFPNCKVKGCNFHFNQCIWRKVQELGLTNGYKENDEIRMHIRRCAALSHLPQMMIDDAWLYIMENCPNQESIEKFNNYFVEQWLENDVIQDMWICSGERHRTTNALEGWHHRLNSTLHKVHPNLLLVLDILKKDAAHYSTLKQKIEPKKKKNKIHRVG